MGDSLRFAMLTTFYPPFNFGGDGIGIERLAHALVRRGHEVEVIHDADAYYALRPGPAPHARQPVPGLRIHRLRSGVGILSPLLTQQIGRPVVNGRRIKKILERGRFDVVNFHNISLLGGPGILKYGTGAKLFMAHEHWLVCPSHVLWRHNRELCTGRQCFRCQIAFHRPPQLYRATKYLERELQNVDAFIAMSEFSRAKHHEFGFPREMEVLPYFLPDPTGEEVPLTTEARTNPRPYFLFVGRLEKIKGLDDVIPLLRVDRGADLLIAGDGEYGEHLRSLAAGLPNVKFLGRVEQETLRTLYRDAIALIVPSVCYETFGIIIVEAFRARLPVIARNRGPFPEIITRAGGGELFDTADELIAAMERLRADTVYRDQLAVAAHAAYLEHWTESAVVPRYLHLVERVRDARRLRAESAGMGSRPDLGRDNDQVRSTNR